ncbi:unnamed protein product [Ectocarpus sp. 4 AP-2014]
MSDAAMKVDPDYYNRRLLETDARVDQSRRAAATAGAGGADSAPSSWGAGGGGVGRGSVSGRGGLPDLPDYLVRQHSLLGLYLSLHPGDEADAERHWGFPQHHRAALVGATVVVPLLLAVFLTGKSFRSWLWKASVIAVATVGARLALSFALATFPDIEVPFQGHVLTVWPHFTIGTLAVMALIWFVCAAASGTGWSTLWLAFTSLLLLACVEAGLRGGMWHFQWWEPANRFSFLKPWGDAYGPVATGPGRSGAGFGAPQPSSYAPPHPMAASAPAPAPRQAEQPYRSPSGSGGSDGFAVGSVGGGGGDGDGSGGMNGGAPAAAVVAQKEESSGLLEENSKEMGDLEDIFSESV